MSENKLPENDSPTSWKQMLQAVMTHNLAADTQLNQEGRLVITVKNRKPAYMVPPISWFVHYSPTRQITLDKIGTDIWKWCDGKNTVEAIVDNFKDVHKLTFHEARASVVDYLKKLIQRGIVAVIIQEKK